MYLKVSSKVFYANALYVAKTTSLTYEELEVFKSFLAPILYDKTGGYFDIGETQGSYPYGSRIPETDFEIKLFDKNAKKYHIVKDNKEITLMEETDNGNVYVTSSDLIDKKMLAQINYYCYEATKECLAKARQQYQKYLEENPLIKKEATLKYRFGCN
ncbi:MAG: hypothetical protein J5892_05425 [Bacilli bacterium]|nr:hypothetical protein [Bacilli bacterium]